MILTCRALRILEILYFRRSIVLVSRALVDASGYLLVPAFMAFTVLLHASYFFMWCENRYNGPARAQFTSIPNTMYWTSMFVIGEWPMADFSPGAGTRVCIFLVLFGVVVFAVPTGIMIETVQSALETAMEEAEELQKLHDKE